jgi:FkbM family methyltransferase
VKPETVVDDVYRAILGREADAGGRSHALSALAAGMTVAQLIGNMLESAEYRRTLVDGALAFRQTKPVCTLIEDRLRLWIDLADRHVSLACLGEAYEPSETQFVLSHLKGGDTFLDIGANVGWFAIRAADRVGATGRVHAFEPREGTWRLLERSIADNDFQARCTLHPVALGADEGTGRLLGHETSTNLGGFRLARDAGDTFEGMTSEAVPVVTLDSLGIRPRVTLIKLDVEGAEPQVLQGGRGLIARDRPLILTEVFGPGLDQVSGVDITGYADLIHSLGYRIHALNDGVAGGVIADLALLDGPHPVNVVLIPAEA